MTAVACILSAYSGIEDMPSGDQSPWNSDLAASNGERLSRRLDSWKEIASHFNRSEKTVRRWEEKEGLPVHRLLHEKRGTVYAYSDELEAWWESRQSHNSISAGPFNQELPEPELEAAFAETAKSDVETFVPTLDGTSETDGSGTEERSPGSQASTQRRQVIFIICGLFVIVGLSAAISLGRFLSSARQKAPSISVHSLAVLPFENLSGDTEQEYFADGMTAELITELAKISSIRVISRTSVMRYKRIRRPLADIARELNVNAVVEGEVLRSQNRVRVTAQLIDTSTDRHLWSETYERDLRDVVSLQADVAQSIAQAIGAQVTPAEDNHRGSTRRVNPDAYEAYLKGRFFLEKRTTTGFKKAADYFQQAVRIDPHFAEAYAGLASTYNVLGTYGILPPNECFPKAREAADKALQLNDSLSEAYTARGFAWTMYERDWSAAEQDFQRAIMLNPNDANAHHGYSEHLTNVGRAEGAISEMKRARELDPLSLPTNATLGRTYRDARRNEEADVQCRKTLELDPEFAMGHWCLGVTHVAEKRYTEAVIEMQRANTLGEAPLYTWGLGYAYAVSGDRIRAEAVIEALKKRPDNAYMPAYYIASIYGALGEKDMAFTWLQRAYAQRDPQITYLLLDPFMDPLRSDVRYDALVRQVGFPR